MQKQLLLACILILSGCTTIEQEATCTQDSQCPLPSEYAIQSNCPFTAACIGGTCEIVCPLHAESAPTGYGVSCTQDTDCNCDERGNRTQECVCHNDVCISVE